MEMSEKEGSTVNQIPLNQLSRITEWLPLNTLNALFGSAGLIRNVARFFQKNYHWLLVFVPLPNKFKTIKQCGHPVSFFLFTFILSQSECFKEKVSVFIEKNCSRIGLSLFSLLDGGCAFWSILKAQNNNQFKLIDGILAKIKLAK